MLTLLAHADAAAAQASAAADTAVSSREQEQQKREVQPGGGSSAVEQHLRAQLQVGGCEGLWAGIRVCHYARQLSPTLTLSVPPCTHAGRGGAAAGGGG
jgi:hypothetical protein